MKQRTVEFFSEGTRLVGDLFLPEDSPEQAAHAGIVLCHGYTGTRKIHLNDVAKAISDAGYATLTFDYRGWGDSEGPRLRLDPFGRVADARAALTYLSTIAEVDRSRLGLFGTSYGGAVAIWAAALDERVRCIVASVAVGHGRRWMRSVRRPDEFYDLLSRAKTDREASVVSGNSENVPRDLILLPDRQSEILGNAARKNNPKAVTELPLHFVDDTLSFHADWVVGKISPRPILFITSDGDRLVPPDESKSLFENAGEPKQLVVLNGFGHYEVYSGEALRQTMDAAIPWYRIHL